MNAVVQEQEVTQMMINLQNSLVDHVPKIIKPSKCFVRKFSYKWLRIRRSVFSQVVKS